MRTLSTSASRRMRLVFVSPNGEEKPVQGAFEGKNILEVAHDVNVDLEGACDCSCACSTCHVVLQPDDYAASSRAFTEEEEDMLDLAFGLTETSRLGCQVVLGPQHDGMRITLPSATRNMYVDGHKPKPH